MLSIILSTLLAKQQRETLEYEGLSKKEVNCIMFKNLIKAFLLIICCLLLVIMFGNYVIEPTLKAIFL